MEIVQIRNQLEYMAGRLMDLAEALSDKGRSLHPEEASLLRQAMFGLVEEHAESVKFQYLMDGRHLMTALEQLRDVIMDVEHLTK